jgi:benzoate-CoA ligase
VEIAALDASAAGPLDIPQRFNAAFDLLERNLRAGRGGKTAFIDDAGSYTYAELASRAHRFAFALRQLGVEPQQRVLLCLKDGIDFPTTFLGTILAGAIPVPVNTLLAAADYANIVKDSSAVALVVSESLVLPFAPLIGPSSPLRHIIVSGGTPPRGTLALSALLSAGVDRVSPAETHRDDPCFWLYSSGSTGAPKGTVHVHASPLQTAALYAQRTLGVHEHDVVFSAAKLFFAYGLGNALTFPLSVGATAVLMAERATPASIAARLRTHRPTLFSGVPTLFASLLASDALPARDELSLRLCNSAGEALPEELARRWLERTGVEIVDGIGSTEMLHIFISNRPGQVCHGTLGVPVPGFGARILNEAGEESLAGEIGDLWVSGPSSARYYWNQPERSKATFVGEWTRTGDRVRRDEAGNYIYAGRADDMLKVGGVYVSPIEVESALVSHPAVQEAAVVGKEDADRLVKPIAFVVLAKGVTPSEALAAELKGFIKSRLAPYKYPRWIEFVDDLPKTATGKVQRFKLRELCKRNA